MASNSKTILATSDILTLIDSDEMIHKLLVSGDGEF
jgi:hypothetical protein